MLISLGSKMLPEQTICREHIKKLFQQALRAYPKECCGVIAADCQRPHRVEKFYPCRNIVNELHRTDPEAFPHTAQDAYVLGGKRWLRIAQKLTEGKLELIAIYHSHVDGEAYFSQEDRARAMMNEDPPTPLFPNALYIVVSVYYGKINPRRPLKAFQWDPSTQNFEEVNLVTSP